MLVIKEDSRAWIRESSLLPPHDVRCGLRVSLLWYNQRSWDHDLKPKKSIRSHEWIHKNTPETYNTARAILNWIPSRPSVSPKPATWLEIHASRKDLQQGRRRLSNLVCGESHLGIADVWAIDFEKTGRQVVDAEEIFECLNVPVGPQTWLGVWSDSDDSLKQANHKSESAGSVFQSNLRKTVRRMDSWSGWRYVYRPVPKIKSQSRSSDL